jgi:hypothetical protein
MPPRSPRSYSVDVLQSSTTVAGIVMGLLSYFSTRETPQAVTFLTFLVGATSLYAVMLSLAEIRSVLRLSWRRFISPKHSLGIMFWSIFVLATAYLFIAYPSTANTLANILELLSRSFRINP